MVSQCLVVEQDGSMVTPIFNAWAAVYVGSPVEGERQKAFWKSWRLVELPVCSERQI